MKSSVSCPNHPSARIAAALVLAAAAAWPLTSAEAQQVMGHEQIAQSQNVVEFSIEAQGLSTAIIEFLRQSGMQIAYRTEDVQDLTTRGLTGRFTPQDALRQLLAGTSLSYRITGDGTATLERNELLRLNPIVIEGSRLGRTLSESSSSVTVISGDEADQPRFRESREVIQGLPNVVSDPGFQAPAIRGIDGSGRATGGVGTITGPQLRIPTIVDGVIQQDSTADTSLWDVEQVEVLRGPQSTAGGRNSLGGAIRITTKDPNMDEYEAAIEGGVRSEDFSASTKLMGNIPLEVLDNQVAFRGTVELRDGEHFLDFSDPTFGSTEDVLEREEFQRYRGKLAFEPNAVPGLRTQFSYDHRYTRQVSQQDEDQSTGDLTITDASEFAGRPQTFRRDTYQGDVEYELSDHVAFEGLVAQQYHNFHQQRRRSSDAGGNFEAHIRELSAETLVKLNNLGVVSKGVAGVSWSRSNADGSSFGESGNNVSSYDAFTRNLGLFGELEFDLGHLGLIDDLYLIAGARYERDSRKRFASLQGGGFRLSGDLKDNTIIPKAGLRYEPTDDLTLGYNYSEGYRPGGLSFDTTTFQASLFGPERLRQHELSARSNWLDDTATLNLATFYYTLTDPQLRGTGLTIENAGRATGYGLEVDGTIELAYGFKLSGGGGWTVTELTDVGNHQNLARFKGRELERSPEFTANLGLGYVAPESVLPGFQADLKMRYMDEMRTAFAEDEMSGYTVFDFVASYGFDGPLGISMEANAFIENMFDKRYLIELSGTRNNVGRPRTVGFSLAAEF